jgi:crotonobetainyl-CoA:carnitine CoA-transferase CaiB-like acyl-CoA transferase
MSAQMDAKTKPMRPLAGLRILDLSKVIAGPLCTQYLCDLGAEVIKVETTAGGDDTRGWPPMRDGTGAVFLSMNRGKKSIALDLKTDHGREIVDRLAAKSDIVVESYAPDVKARLGVDYDRLKTLRPGLIYCSISGFGQTGPLRLALGYDNILQAFTGLMAMTGEKEGGPTRVPVSPIDQTTGMNAAIGIQAALLHREKTGEGAYLEVSLFETAVGLLGFTLQTYWEQGVAPVRIGSAHQSICPYQVFETSDKPVLLGIANDRLWQRFCLATGNPALGKDARFLTNVDRVAHYAETVGIVQGILRPFGSAHWVELLNSRDVPCTPVNTIADLAAHEHTAARGIIVEYERAGTGRLKGVASPIQFNGVARTAGSAPPALGEHTVPILQDLGYDEAEIHMMREMGHVRA